MHKYSHNTFEFNALQAKAECTIIDDDPMFVDQRNNTCDSLKVNGTLAGDTGVYPQVEVEFSWELCNYNVADLPGGNYAVNLLGGKKRSIFQLWNNREKPVIIEKYGKSMTLGAVGSNVETCISLTRQETLDTSIPYWYMSAQLEGLPTYDGVNRIAEDAYCYAYAFTPIRPSYGDCNMSVSSIYFPYIVFAEQ